MRTSGSAGLPVSIVLAGVVTLLITIIPVTIAVLTAPHKESHGARKIGRRSGMSLR
ncbi:MAG TPA: hypothetical protein VNA15_05235 [Candidatus Angelobacter sp.]|nr:hypothetical protein [Candidatus Angelobacter sp.]